MARREAYNPLLKSYPDSDRINRVSIGAETLYTRLIAQSDDAGRYYGEAKWIVARLFTARMVAGQVTEKQVAGWLTELEDVGLLYRYHSTGATYLELIGVYKTMRKDVKPQHVYPAPDTEAESRAWRERDEFETATSRDRNENGPLDQTNTRTRTTPDQNHTAAASPPSRFKKPSIEEVRTYCAEHAPEVDAQRWFDHYESNGWKVGKNPMKDWRAAVRTWRKSEFGGASSKAKGVAQL